ncbi:MAG TPA: alpha/beta hydrolase [Alphaproteobacteria bacterium]|nr:alpha/beta hydrolase [Alphaproteobacteria bacterium]
MGMIPEYLSLPDRRLCYQRVRGEKDRPGVMFLGGFGSDMAGTKAGFLHENCVAAGFSFLRFDYRGHGGSDGAFRDGTIGAWFEDALAAFDRLTEGPQTVIGSSMGGWVALLLARARPERVAALVGVAAAPDFTEDLIWARLSAEQRAAMAAKGEIADPTAPLDQQLPITLKLIEEARAHLLLRAPLGVACPVRLLQGMKDAEVPWGHALRLAERITHDDVQVTLVKDGDHRLNRPQDLELLWRVVGQCSNISK